MYNYKYFKKSIYKNKSNPYVYVSIVGADKVKLYDMNVATVG